MSSVAKENKMAAGVYLNERDNCKKKSIFFFTLVDDHSMEWGFFIGRLSETRKRH